MRLLRGPAHPFKDLDTAKGFLRGPLVGGGGIRTRDLSLAVTRRIHCATAHPLNLIIASIVSLSKTNLPESPKLAKNPIEHLPAPLREINNLL